VVNHKCFQVGAYLAQKHGLTNVRRLKHGIIGYERWANEEDEGAGEYNTTTGAAIDGEGKKPAKANGAGMESIWEGENFIFDQRRIS